MYRSCGIKGCQNRCLNVSNQCCCSRMLFSITDEVENQVVAIRRDCQGRLVSTKVYNTGGSGSGRQQIDPLQSQHSVKISPDGRFLFVVNAGSNSISSFMICGDGLMLQAVVPSGGIFPNSLTVAGNYLYVTNVGDSNNPSNVVGFKISGAGCLDKIAEKRLSEIDTQPGDIVASPCNDMIAVTEKATNRISIFNIGYNGCIYGPMVTDSNGNVPFSLAYINGEILINAEAASNALTSYRVEVNEKLEVISGSVENGQQATCWVVVTPNGRYAYTSNTASGTISQYNIDHLGNLTFVSNTPSVQAVDGAPIDMGIDKCGKYLYALNARQGTISVFKILDGGTLDLIQVYSNTELPAISPQGIAVL